MKTAITGGSVDVLIDGDTIAATGNFELPADAELIDATGLHVMPGLIDLGVFAVEADACAAGGITRVALMPDQAPPLDDPGLVQRAALAAKPRLWVHPLAAATKGLAGLELAEYALMRRAGAKAVATGRGWIADSGVMCRVLAYAASLGLTVIAHSEDAGLAYGAVATEGATATLHGLSAAPAIAEAMAIARDLALAGETGAAIHFRQVTTTAGFDLIRMAKARGLRVTCGISPAHLLLSDIAMSDFRTFARLSPPLRSERDRQAARAALTDGTIDVLCSSHDPRGPEAKRLPFADAEPGASAAETLFTLGLGLVRDGVMDLARLATLTSANPATILGVDAGRLEPGAPADLCLVDVEKPWVIDGARFASSAGNTPFQGLPVQGRAVRTLKGGRTIFG
ncbi:MAG: dihydroorotase [Sphingomonadaceae bacterium]|nr:dihydroorotase [Sphingomonadaceae bacterium]